MAAQRQEAPGANTPLQCTSDAIKSILCLAEHELNTAAEVDEQINAAHILLKTYRKILITRINQRAQP